MPYKLLYAHHDPSISGSGISLRNLLSSLDRSQFEPRVLLSKDGPVRSLYEQLNIKVDVVPVFGFNTSPGAPWYKLSWWLNWRSFFPNRALSGYLASTEWDLLHINDKALLVAGLAAQKFSKPIVWHLRSSYHPTYSRLNVLASSHTIQSLADRLIAISEDEVDGFENSNCLDVIYNSVDFSAVSEARSLREKTRAELGLSDRDILIGQVSTAIGEVRGTWDFLHACGLIGRKLGNPLLRFMVVAGIPERKRIPSTWLLADKSAHPEDQAWQIAEEENITDRLTLTGFRKDALNLMAAMDVVVVCNRHGVLGRMPFEAMALGCPLVATAGHSGRSRVVIDQETALVVPPANPAAIADAVCTLLLNPALAQAIANQGFAYARQRFDPIKNARLIEEIYLDLLG